MFVHNFKYAFKTLFRNRMLIFWTFAFPIILGTLFNMAFSNIENSEKLNIIDIAIVDNSDFQKEEAFKESFKVLGDEKNEDRLFNIKYTDEEDAKRLLNDEKITGYLTFEEGKPRVTVITNGINETIFKYVTEEISQSIDITRNVLNSEIQKEIMQGNYNVDYEKIYRYVLDMTLNQEAGIKDISSNNLSYMMIEFYTLIAMTCLYGGILGIRICLI